jgi:DNA modification methylase
MNLLQDRLDVRNKKRANVFNWRGQFTPDFIEYLIDSLTITGNEYIADPFSGSGTVLFEAAQKSHSAIGLEINPAAYLMSKFYTLSEIPFSKRIELLRKFEFIIERNVGDLNGALVYIDNKDYRIAYRNLIKFGKHVSESLDEMPHKILLLNLLFMSEKDKKISLRESVFKSFSRLESAFIGLPYSEAKIDAQLQDARKLGALCKEKVDLIITSPPYINVFNYHQNYRAIVEAFNYDILKVAHSEFGSNRKNRSNRLRTVVQYCLDMEQSILSFWEALKPGGKMVLVVGRESNVRKTPFYNGKIVSQIIQASQGFGELHNLERSFTNKFGADIKEDILVATKTNSSVQSGSGREIARENLKNAFKFAPGEVKSDFLEIFETIDKVEPSPIFNKKHIFSKHG